MNLLARDKQTLWHPFTQHQTTPEPIAIVRGEGAYLIDADGKRYLDLISSWWVNLHGHCHPEIAQAIYNQATTLEHVLFAGFTHEPAIDLAEKILQLMPAGFTKLFYSDNGSTAVEIALKMAYQYWYNREEKQRTRFMAFSNGYHGDTVGAMSVGQGSGFFKPFNDLLFQVDLMPYPVTSDTTTTLKIIEAHLQQYAKQTAAIIIEPLVQGAGGMQMCSTDFLQQLEKLAKATDALIIYDEVMTGFGRTGKYFACVKAQTQPDIVCLAKGITGGFLPLAATVCREEIYQAFLGAGFNKAFAHGHSFTANPLGCAAGLASLALLTNTYTQNQLQMIERVHEERLSGLSETDIITNRRYCGTIAAFDVKMKTTYGSTQSQFLQQRFLAKGLLIRPLGNVLYFMPPYCITETQLHQAYDQVIAEILGVA